jgi:FG-GAP repeat/IPT/TIG domain
VGCTNVIWQSYNEILCTLPAGSSGSATVVVTNSGGASGSSSSVFSYVAPNNPTGFTATPNHSSQITLSWASGGGTTATYQVAYQTGSTAPASCSSGTVISYATIGASTSIAVTGLSLATQDYAFRVCARDSSGAFSSGTTMTGTTGWYQEAYLKAPNADVYDSFGGDGAISISGNTVVVGAAYEDSNQTTITNGTTATADNSKSGSGAAYVFKRTGTAWAQEVYLKAPNADASDYFGYSFSISGDTVVVGAPLEDSSQTIITNGTTASTDNNKADSGAAYVFKRTGTAWAQEAYLKAPNADASDNFGNNPISISGDTIVIGVSGEDSNQATITAGTTASADNSKINSGAAYVFKRTGSTWAQEAYLKAPNADASDSFGSSISISADTVVVGANKESSNQTTITNGTTASADNSAAFSGAAYVFKRTGTTWAQEAYLKAPNADSSDIFGFPVSISGDTIVVGAYGEDSNQTTITNGATASSDNSKSSSGAAYVFKRLGSLWVQEAYLKAPNGDVSDYFGYSVAISGDTIAVGAKGEDSNQATITNGTTASSDNTNIDSGAVYVFRRTFTSATPTVTSVTPTSGAAAGNNIIIFGTNFRLGATATVGTAACTSVTVQGPNEIICTLGTKPTTGALTVTVTNPDTTAGSLSSAYTYP